MARDLSALMKVSTTINAIRGVEELQKTLLELLFEVVPAERGAILLDGRRPVGADRSLLPCLAWTGGVDPIRKSR